LIVGDEIAFVEARASYVDRLEDLYIEGRIPKRIAHNDMKVNNLLIDKQSGKGICVTDLDTTMPGLVLHDFGDMVRTATNNAAEDELDLDLVRMQIEIFGPLAEGYLSKAGQFLNPIEMKELVFSCKVIVLEIGMRFLTDYLLGDVYFKTQREGHNLDRSRAQFRLLTSIEEQEELMELIVASIPS
jgi:aminoglycoside phosphotransferase (APT) family kinase protein